MTAHTPTQPNKPANRLARESSPYLLQHAHNPVDWFPWGAEAFDESRRRGVPIFLSIGYSTCYWCHVMERESFEDEATARLMNDAFVCVKLDREERPDVDDAFMTATTAMTGHGGWPMSVFLTPPGAAGPADPGLEPFYCGTYIPPEPRHGMPSFSQVLEGVARAWRERRAEILQQAEALAAHAREQLDAAASSAPAPLGPPQIESALATLLRLFDRAHGGFGQRGPKFPQPLNLEFLLDALDAAGDDDTRAAINLALQTTLDRMAMGGMHDQIGAGFHRYSVDEQWLVPHFEKMLYDNALLLRVYARRAAATGDGFHRNTAEEIVAFIAREMTSARSGGWTGGGAFFSAQDAEVDGREGVNYLWTPAQIDEVFGSSPTGADDARFAKQVFGLDAGPNFRDPHHPHEPPSNVLFLPEHPASLAERAGMAPREFFDRRTRLSRAMRQARDRRPQPRLDDKIIASWNGLMIASLADAASLLNEPAWLEMARGAAEFCWTTLRSPDGALVRSWRRGASGGASGGVPGPPGVLEDYAALALAFLALTRATASESERSAWLDRANELLDAARARFFEHSSRRWYDIEAGRSDLFVRARSTHDGAVPSGQSLLVHALLDLHELTGDARPLDEAAALLASISVDLAENPVSAINANRALLRILRASPDALARAGVPPISPPAAADEPGAARPGAPPAEIDSPVAVYASAERIAVARNASAALDIELRIDDGWHIVAHDPFAPTVRAEDRLAGLVGLTIRIAGGSGVAAQVVYPVGKPYEIPDPGAVSLAPILVHSGAVHLRVTLTRTAVPVTGKPLLLITYQPCNDRACLKHVTVELDVAIDAL